MKNPFKKLLWISPASTPLREGDKVYGGTIGIYKLIQLEAGLLIAKDLMQGRISIAIWRFSITLMAVSI